MTALLQVYKCEACGNIVEVIHAGDGELVCCGKPMVELSEKSQEAGNEKHVPIVEKTDKGIKVKVGSVPHPMEENHYIEWIEVIAEGAVYRKILAPGDAPEAEFEICAQNITAREHCTVHGLWKS
ncbi:MAG: desulfoferrodoxin [Candidatus Ancaeobacter aquaticus]|nr:desulfoferrodoxin [Candidatus Ancaeobacter aquaticus]